MKDVVGTLCKHFLVDKDEHRESYFIGPLETSDFLLVVETNNSKDTVAL